MTELIIDVSYKCNSSCKYCRWNITNHQKKEITPPLDQLLLPKESIRSLNVSRIVLSGGEPILADNLDEVINYYKNFSLPIRLITNGIHLTSNNILRLSGLGIKEYVISLNTISYDLYSKLCEISKEDFEKIMLNLENISLIRQKDTSIVSYIGLNVVLTNLNCKWNIFKELLKFAKENDFNQIKYQPVFDDGYLSKNAPELSLKKDSIAYIDEIILNLNHYKFKSQFTNPIGFWQDLKQFLQGIELPTKNCAVGNNSILLHKGTLKFCFWCHHSSYGPLNQYYSPKDINKIRKKFNRKLDNCTILPQCFCLQPIDHIWS